MKKALSLVLSVVMLLSVIAGMNITAFADNKISVVTLTLDQPPYAGANPEFISENANPNLQYTVDKSAYTNGVKWYDQNEGAELGSNDTFVLGHSYVIKVRVKANSGWKFDTENISCTFGGAEAGVSRVESGTSGDIIMMEDSFDVYLVLDCIESASVISTYNFSSVTEPLKGKNPVWSAVNNSTGFSIDTSRGINGFEWEEFNGYNANVQWIKITDPNYKFKQNSTYRFTVYIKADRGYVFNNSSNDVHFDNTSAIVNYDSKIYQSSNRYSKVFCNYICNDLISAISVRGKDHNVRPGESPSYSFYADVYYDDPYAVYTWDSSETTKDGVYYYDETAGEYMYVWNQESNKHTDFVLNHQYTMYVLLYAKDGYIFNDYDKIDARYNGAKASVVDQIPGESALGNKKRNLYVKYNMGVCKNSLDKCTVGIGMSSRTYNGKALQIPLYIYDGDKLLYQDKDYTVSYSNNVNVGTAKMTIKGIGNYKGTRYVTFKITAKKITPKVNISATKYTYDGKNKRPTVTVYDGTKKLKKDTDYTVKYSKTESKIVGKYYVQVKLKGNYSGSKQITYTIVPPKTSFDKGQCGVLGKNQITIGCYRKYYQVTGYQFEYSTYANFSKNSKTTKTRDYSLRTVTIKNLKKNTKYYCRVRCYKNVTINGKTVTLYSDWSGVKEMKTKK